MKKTCKKIFHFPRRQFAPCLIFPFFFNCSNIPLFNCFSTSSFRVPCSNVLPSRVKMKIFTLIELLIVVAVIAILAAMLLPALNSAREKARGISCLNNHNTIGKAVQMYVSDNQDYFFPYSHWTGGVSGSGSQIIWWNRTNGFINEYLQVKEPDTHVGYILGRDSESYGYDRRSRFACPSQEARVDQTFTINYFYGLDSVLVTKITRYRHPSRTLRTSDYLATQTTGACNYAEEAPGSFRHKEPLRGLMFWQGRMRIIYCFIRPASFRIRDNSLAGDKSGHFIINYRKRRWHEKNRAHYCSTAGFAGSFRERGGH